MMLICTGEFGSKLEFYIALILNGSQYHSHILLRAHPLISKKPLQEEERITLSSFVQLRSTEYW